MCTVFVESKSPTKHKLERKIELHQTDILRKYCTTSVLQLTTTKVKSVQIIFSSNHFTTMHFTHVTDMENKVGYIVRDFKTEMKLLQQITFFTTCKCHIDTNVKEYRKFLSLMTVRSSTPPPLRKNLQAETFRCIKILTLKKNFVQIGNAKLGTG